MLNRVRSKNARAAAEAYAPTPNGSTLTYGVIAAAFLLVAAFTAGGFFGVDILSNPLLLAGMTILAFLAGVVLRLWRQREHRQAFEAEYARRSPATSAADASGGPAQFTPVGSVVAPVGQGTVTFKSPFMLPGLDHPHSPGTFRLMERREPLDVSWSAFTVVHTIMLTMNGTTEALEVKQDDLEEALRRDQN